VVGGNCICCALNGEGIRYGHLEITLASWSLVFFSLLLMGGGQLVPKSERPQLDSLERVRVIGLGSVLGLGLRQGLELGLGLRLRIGARDVNEASWA